MINRILENWMNLFTFVVAGVYVTNFDVMKSSFSKTSLIIIDQRCGGPAISWTGPARH